MVALPACLHPRHESGSGHGPWCRRGSGAAMSDEVQQARGGQRVRAEASRLARGACEGFAVDDTCTACKVFDEMPQ